MHTRTTTAAAVLLLATLTACSGPGHTEGEGPDPTASAPATSSKPSTTPTPADAAELTAAVQAYTTAYFKGEGSTAHRMLSERCKKEINELVYGATVDQAAKEYGPDHPATDVKAEVSGTLARVSYKVKGLPKFDQQAQPWTREDGAWKYDAC